MLIKNTQKLWLLLPIEGLEPDPWEPWYDKSFGHIVRAESEVAARELVAKDIYTDPYSEAYGNEGGDVWLSSTTSICEELTANGEPGVILTDTRMA